MPTDFPVVGAVNFALSSPGPSWDEPDNYVRQIVGRITALTSDLEEHDAGELECLLVHVTNAVNDEVPLSHVCDAHSDFMAAVYASLFVEENETKPDRARNTAYAVAWSIR